MNKIISILFFVGLLSSPLSAQLKIGYIDSDTIMDNLPDVQDARQKLDAMIRDWQTELRNLEAEHKKKKDDFDKRNLVMTDQTRTEAEKELAVLGKGISDFRDKKFGPKGELFQKQDELMKPLQNKIFNVIQEIAADEDFDYVFDRSGDIIFLYAKPEYDLTAKVLEQLQE
ncbi:MAG: OmpH family outer membrane protein [Ignavibacteriae bacterium]|nr:MAG: OmpH family outer membrane protein [Ignavibacteriota bacterium]